MVRLAQIQTSNGQTKLTAQLPNDQGYIDLTTIAPNVRDFLNSTPTSLERANALIASSDRIVIPVQECRLLSPLNGSLVGKFICIGMNYVDHCTEQNVPIPEEPVIFNKFGSAIVGTGDPIPYDKTVTTKLDYEVELAFVIGKTVPRNITKEEAMSYVGGYSVVHDVSARDLQLEQNGGQWLLGKCQDGYAPLGPVIITPDEVSDVHDLGIRCRVNGKTLQDSSTSQLIHKVDQLVAYLSKFMTLCPGDVIATGTPPGVGCFRKPPIWLKPGDVVECEIDGIGTITNPVVEVSSTEKSATSMQPSMGVGSVGKLANQICIVTGGAQGLGFGIAARLGLEGAKFCAVVDLDKDKIDAACDSLKTISPSCKYYGMVCDVTDTEAVKTTWANIATEAAAKGEEGKELRLDVLVQAAGIVGTTNLKTEDVDPDDFDNVFRVNVKGIFNGCKAILPYMKQNNYGRIVNIASISGKDGNAGMLAYSASKAAVINLTKVIGKEYADLDGADITCNALAPAVVKTKMVQDMPDAQVKYMTDKIPMKRCGTIEEIGAMVAFIVSPEASFTTGFCFDATGGRAVY